MAHFKSSISLVAIPLLLLAFAGCNESSSLSSKDKKNPPEEDNEDEQADTPVEVSGSFLTSPLMCDWIGDPSQGEDTVAGCAVVDKNGETLDRTDRTFGLSLHNTDNSNVDMVSTDSPNDSEWHKLAKIPASHLETGYLKMTMTKGGAHEGTFKLNTSDIGKSIGLGNHAEGTEYEGGESSLTSITTHGQWIDKFKGNMSLKMSDFCETDGNLRTQLTIESDLMVTLADELLQTKTTNKNIVIKETKISASSSACFVQFRELGGRKEIAHKNSQATCFYLHTGPNLHIISVKKAQAENPDFNLDNLRKFASAKACR